MRKTTYTRFSLLFLAVYFAGCATIIRGTDQDLQINSEPVGAKASLSNGMSCFTPCVLRLSRKQSYTVKYEKEGCDPSLISIYPTLSGSGVLLGGIIDYGTGAVYDLHPNPAVVNLVCKEQETATPYSVSDDSLKSPCDPGYILKYASVKSGYECIKKCPPGYELFYSKEKQVWECQELE